MEWTIRLLGRDEEPPYALLLSADPSKAIVDDYVRRGRVYIAASDNGTIGEFVLIETRPHTIEIVNIAVDERFQGQGIGTALIHIAVEEARRSHARVLEIGTGNSSFNQLRLYQKCGFRVCGVDVGFFVKHYEEAIYEDGLQVTDMIRLRMEL